MRILLVGGAVRNLLLGRPPGDKDFLVLDAGESEFRARFPSARKVGRAFPVYWLGGSEFAFPRAASLEQDLAARDFTLNALALDSDGGLFCHPQALEDMRDRILRPCSPCSLADDPLRVFRAARFLAQFPELTPHPDLLAAMEDAARAGLLANLSAERVGRELLKALAGPQPSRFPALLARTGCLDPWFAELARCRDVPAGPAPAHDSDVFGHTLAVLDRLAGDPLRAWMGLCHDLGKAATPPAEWPRHHGHDRAGAALARGLGARLRLSEEYQRAGETAAFLHMTAARYPELRPGTRVDLLLRAGNLLEPLLDLVRADHGLDVREQALAERARILAVRLPEALRDRGPESGKRLRELRAQALSHVISLTENSGPE
jgi:tRNA nucleotidyltransferase (CCA-adding enzyme)